MSRPVIPQLKVGDRVSRQINIGQPERKQGTITDVYFSKPSSTSPPRRLYAVKWDNGVEDRGYFQEGLERC